MTIYLFPKVIPQCPNRDDGALSWVERHVISLYLGVTGLDNDRQVLHQDAYFLLALSHGFWLLMTHVKEQLHIPQIALKPRVPRAACITGQGFQRLPSKTKNSHLKENMKLFH